MSATANTIAFLEMRNRRSDRSQDAKANIELQLVEPTDGLINRKFYREVGADWEWVDRLGWMLDEWQTYATSPTLRTFVAQFEGEEIGYCELDIQNEGDVELVYFGLLSKFIGHGLGRNFLDAVIDQAWDFPIVKRVWLHTCSNDHPRALENYISCGFKIYKIESVSELQ